MAKTGMAIGALSLLLAMAGCKSDRPNDTVTKQELSSASELPGASGGSGSPIDKSSAMVLPTDSAAPSVVPPATSSAPKAVLPVIPKVASTEGGAVSEDLGPCHGRGNVAGSMTVDGKTEYICGDGSREYYPYGRYDSRYGADPRSRRYTPYSRPRQQTYRTYQY